MTSAKIRMAATFRFQYDRQVRVVKTILLAVQPHQHAWLILAFDRSYHTSRQTTVIHVP